MNQISHPYWGDIKGAENGGGFIAGRRFAHPFFGEKTTKIFLGGRDVYLTKDEMALHPGEIYKPVNSFLSQELLSEFETVYADFENRIETYLLQLRQHVYASYREDFATLSMSFEDFPLIGTMEEHDGLIRSLAFLRLLPGGQLELALNYPLFPAPVYIVVFENGVISPATP